MEESKVLKFFFTIIRARYLRLGKAERSALFTCDVEISCILIADNYEKAKVFFSRNDQIVHFNFLWDALLLCVLNKCVTSFYFFSTWGWSSLTKFNFKFPTMCSKCYACCRFFCDSLTLLLIFSWFSFFFVKNLNTSVDDFFFFLADWYISNKVTVVKYLNISLHHHHHLRRNDDGVIVSARVFFHV